MNSNKVEQGCIIHQLPKALPILSLPTFLVFFLLLGQNRSTLAKPSAQSHDLAPEITSLATAAFSSSDPSVIKRINQDLADLGETLGYVITHNSTENSIVTGLKITDPLPEYANYGSVAIRAGAGSSLSDSPIFQDWTAMGREQAGTVNNTTMTTTTMPYTSYLPLVSRNFAPFCNGSFETGDFTCWTHGGGLDRSVVRAPVYEGNYAVELGSGRYACRNGVPVESAWISQTFTVPPCYDPLRPKPTLSFKYAIFSQDILKGDRWDSLDVYIDGTLILRDGNDEWEEARCDTFWNSDWRSHSKDLSAYKGQNVEVTFHNVNRIDGWYNTWTYVDDIQVTCEP